MAEKESLKHENGNGIASVAGSTVKLKREMGLFSAVNLILGVMIGSGIFVSPASALKESGSVGLCLIIWTISGIISLLGALSFAELGTVVNKSGAEYAYFQEAFGSCHKFLGPLPAFTCAWIYVMILRPAEVAIIVMTFAAYAIQPFSINIPPESRAHAIKLASLSALWKITGPMFPAKMSNESNSQTCKVLNNEIKALQTQCKALCYIIDNNESMHIRTINPRNANEKKLCNIENLAKNIQNDETPIITDDNVTTSLFLSEIKEKIVQVEELTAFTRGAVQDVENENNRLRASIKLVQEAKSRPTVGRREVQPEHLQQAKRRFQTMKTELQRLIHSLFPAASEAITGILGELMREKMNETSTGYIQVTPENYHLIELLKDKNIVSSNPYNKMEVKLAY